MALRKERSVVVLGVDSNYEEVTIPIERYRSKHVYPEFRKNGAEVIRLFGSTATREDFIVAAANPDVDYITGVGHGDYDTYTGHHYNKILVVGCYKPSEVKGRIVHLLSCRTARDLGPDTIKSGAVSFFGYIKNFNLSMTYCDDFVEADAQIDYVLANSGTVSEAHQAAIDKFNFYIEKYTELELFRLAAVFEYDRDILRSPVINSKYGDPDAVLS